MCHCCIECVLSASKFCTKFRVCYERFAFAIEHVQIFQSLSVVQYAFVKIRLLSNKKLAKLINKCSQITLYCSDNHDRTVTSYCTNIFPRPRLMKHCESTQNCQKINAGNLSFNSGRKLFKRDLAFCNPLPSFCHLSPSFLQYNVSFSVISFSLSEDIACNSNNQTTYLQNTTCFYSTCSVFVPANKQTNLFSAL